MGELDLGSRRLLPDLYDILALSGSGIDLRLDAVGFCDCSGLNVLLDLRMRALDLDKTVAVRSSGRSVERVLDLTGTRELLTNAVPRPPAPAPLRPTPTRPCGPKSPSCDGRCRPGRPSIWPAAS